MVLCNLLGFVSGLFLCASEGRTKQRCDSLLQLSQSRAVQQAHECLYIPLCLYIAKLCRARVQHPLTLPAEPQDLAGQRTMHHHFHSIPHSSSAAACLPCGNMLSSCTAATPRQGC